MDLSIIIVNWNTRDLLAACLRSIRTNVQGVRYEVFVVDNHSTDDSVAMVHAHFPWTRLITNKTNRGFAAANNQAIIQCRGDYILLLNPDTLLERGVLEHLVAFLQTHPEAGGVGGRLLEPDGSEPTNNYYRRFPTLLSTILFYTFLKRYTMQQDWLLDRFWHWPLGDQPREVDQPPGACLMVRREVVQQVGLLDENFFVWFEDVDWCYRIKRAGWKLYYVPQAVIIHVGGSSFKAFVPAEFELKLLHGLLKFYRKHHGRVRAALLQGVVCAFYGIEWVERLLRLKLKKNAFYEPYKERELQRCALVFKGLLYKQHGCQFT